MLNNYKSDDQKKASFSELGNLAKHGGFWAVIIYVVGSSIYGVYDQQFQVFFVSKFEDAAEGTRMYGFLNSSQVLLRGCLYFYLLHS